MLFEILLHGQLSWNLPLVIVLLFIFVMYFFAVKYYANIDIYHRRSLIFFLGLCLLYVSLGSPLSTLSHLSFSTHMIQMSVLYFIVPPLFIISLPGQMTNKLQIKCNSYLPLILFSILFFLYHFPNVLAFLYTIPYLQKGYTGVLFILAFLMWLPIARGPSTEEYDPIKRKRYTFLSGILLMPACLLFIVNGLFSSGSSPALSQLVLELCLPAQVDANILLPFPFNTRFDQMIGGAIMMALHKFALMFTFQLSQKAYTHKSAKHDILPTAVRSQ